MALPNFIFFISDQLGWSYYVDVMGNIQRQYTPKGLESVPFNLAEMELKWGRSDSKAGLQQTYSTPAQWVKDARKIINYFAYTKGSEHVLLLRIYKLNKNYGAGLRHELFYESEFDLSKHDRQTDYTATMLMEGGPEKLIKAGEATDFEIDVTDDPEAVDVLLDGILFKNKFNYSMPSFEYVMPNKYHILPIAYINRDGITGTDVLSGSSSYQQLNSIGDLADSPNWFYSVPPAFTFRIQGSVKFLNKEGSAFTWGFRIMSQYGAVYFDEPPTLRNVGQIYTVDFDETVTLPLPIISRAQLYIVAYPNGSGITNPYFELFETSVTITFDYVYKWSLAKALPAKILFTRLLTKMLGYIPTVNSNLLTNGTDILYTCGDAIRRLPSAKIKTSFNKFFAFNHMYYCAGFDVVKDSNNKAIAILEKRNEFYKNEEIINVGNAKLTDKFADELMFNEISIGYPNQDYGEVNGRGEFNVTLNYSTPIKRIIKKLDLTTQYRADMIGIEITRINLQNKETTDSSSDNDTFVLFVEKTPVTDTTYSPDPFYRLDRSVNASATGLIHAPSAFNIQLSPANCLRNHGWYVRSCLWYEQDKKITFQTSDKNADLSYTNANGVSITEKADIAINSLDAPLFKPRYLSIETATPLSIHAAMQPKPKGYISFTSYNNGFKGFPIDVGIKPVTEEAQTWQLLCHVDNDLTKLIDT